MSLNKRHKRDRSARAWSKGYQAGLIGRSQEQCPHEAELARSQWLDGWAAGHSDHETGTVAIGGMHKRPL